jgi:hypothetical protein
VATSVSFGKTSVNFLHEKETKTVTPNNKTRTLFIFLIWFGIVCICIRKTRYKSCFLLIAFFELHVENAYFLFKKNIKHFMLCKTKC